MAEHSGIILDEPDPNFALTPEQRGESFFDPDIVEQILRWVRPQDRERFRRGLFASPEHGSIIDSGFQVSLNEHPELFALFRKLAEFETDQAP